jgi:MFS family permease
MRESLRFVLGHRAILATSLVEALQYLAYGAVETFLPVYAAERCGLSEWQIGVLLGAKVVTITLTKPLSGRTSDEVGRRPSIAAGLLVSAVTLSLLPAFRSFWPLLLMATGFGLGVSIVTASTSAFVADLSRAGQHGASLGILSTIMDLGHSTGPMLAGLLIAALGYGRSYLSLAVLVAGGAVLFLLTAPGEPGTENQAAKPGERGS